MRVIATCPVLKVIVTFSPTVIFRYVDIGWEDVDVLVHSEGLVLGTNGRTRAAHCGVCRPRGEGGEGVSP